MILQRIGRHLIPLRLRNAARLAVGSYPKPLRQRFPDIEVMGLRREAVVIDVGANVGDFAECVLAFQPWASLHLIEPLEEALPELRRKFGEYPTVAIRNCAFGSEQGEKELHVCNYDQASSLLESGPALGAGSAGLDFSRKESRRVQVRTLGEYILETGLASVDLLKLDVQGYELEVLKGAGENLSRIDWIYAEAQFQELYRGGPHFSDLFEYLKPRGFDLLRMTAFRSDDHARLTECDMIFRRRQRNGESR